MDLIPIVVEAREMTSLEALDYWLDGEDPVQLARMFYKNYTPDTEEWDRAFNKLFFKKNPRNNTIMGVFYHGGSYYIPYDETLLILDEGMAKEHFKYVLSAVREYDLLKTDKSMAEFNLPIIESFEEEYPNEPIWHLIYTLGFVDLDANDDSDTIIFCDRSCLSWEQGKWKVGSV